VTDYQHRVAELEHTLTAQAATNGKYTAPVEQSNPGEDVRLDVLTARDLCALPDPLATDELLGPLLIRGHRLVLGAHTGEGKSTMTAAIIRAIVEGDTFLDWTGSGGRALIIDAEQGLRTIKRRLREAGLDQSTSVDYLRAPDGLSLDRDARQIAALEQQLGEGSYSVVAADPLYKLHTGDSNAEREAVDLMRTFDRWRATHHFALILPVHCRKPPIGAKFSMHEFFGSSAYLRGAEVIIGLQRVRDGYSRLHFFKDRDSDLPVGTAWGLLYNHDDGYRRDPDDRADRKNAADQVRDLIEADPGITQAQLREATGYAERTIRKALRELNATDSGSVNSHGERGWQLPLTEDAEP
jgi:AAA domain